jgi:hypothetical protein
VIVLAQAALAAPEIDVRLNNNPKAETQLESTAKKETWTIASIPSVRVNGRGFPEGKTKLTVKHQGRSLGSALVSVKDGGFEHLLTLAEPLSGVSGLKVQIGKHAFDVLVRLRRLHGRVTTFDGAAVSKPIIRGCHGETAFGDDAGRYELFLSGPCRDVAVFDRGYTKTTLEPWLYGVDLPGDLELNPRMDRMEVESLNAWTSATTLHAFFVPMSLGHVQRVQAKGAKGEAEAAVDPSAWPRLKASDVRMYLGDEALSPLTLNELVETFSIAGQTGRRWVYVASVPRIASDGKRVDVWGKVLRVEIQTRLPADAGERLERGEGYFLGFMKRP